ncbi:uncharacterized protein LOC100213736 [Hydra vulgaris]|uniref:uncharacterized protein LOC100213736 n=1 Tax=Hydra vulgaris TaxID=6087 RepID=UPI0001923BA5|nr:uncharacterized protein LOC100213736 [Hydra vulgaris]
MANKQRVCCVAVDENKWSEQAFLWYVENNYTKEDTLVVLHVQSIPDLSCFNLLGGIRVLEEFNEKLRATVENEDKLKLKYNLLCNQLNIEFKFVTVEKSSSVGKAVCDFLCSNSVNVVVLGKRWLSNVESFILGSTSDYVLHHSEIPVIIVPFTR